MSELSNRERFLRCMRYESVDHPPLVLPGPWAAARRRWESEGLPKDANLNDYFEVPELKYIQVKLETVFHPAFKEVILEETDEYVG